MRMFNKLVIKVYIEIRNADVSGPRNTDVCIMRVNVSGPAYIKGQCVKI